MWCGCAECLNTYSRPCKEEALGVLCTLRWIRVSVKGLSFPPTVLCPETFPLFMCWESNLLTARKHKQLQRGCEFLQQGLERTWAFCHLKQSRQGSTSQRTLMSHLITPSAHLTSWHGKPGWQMYCQNTNLSTSSCKSTHRCFTVEIWGQTNILTYRVTL